MSRNKGSVNHNIGGLFTFGLVGVFAILSMLLAVIGVNAYQSVIDTSGLNNEVRASMSYVANKVRTGDVQGYVRIDQYAGKPILVITQDEEGETYETFIYLYDGAIQEYLKDIYDSDFYPEYGSRLVEVQDFDVQWAGQGLIVMHITTLDGRTHVMNMAVRSEL